MALPFHHVRWHCCSTKVCKGAGIAVLPKCARALALPEHQRECCLAVSPLSCQLSIPTAKKAQATLVIPKKGERDHTLGAEATGHSLPRPLTSVVGLTVLKHCYNKSSQSSR